MLHDHGLTNVGAMVKTVVNGFLAGFIINWILLKVLRKRFCQKKGLHTKYFHNYRKNYQNEVNFKIFRIWPFVTRPMFAPLK